MMAAIKAAEAGHKVILAERKPSLGRKLLLTGKGRCNLTNSCDIESFLRRFSKSGQFLRDAFKIFFNKELIDFFESRGVRLKTERQLRVFPEGDDSNIILKCLKKELDIKKVEVLCEARAESIKIEKGRAKSVRFKNKKLIEYDAVVLATGGVSYPSTGSTGDGFKMAGDTGHIIKKPLPGLIPLLIREKYPKALQGLTLKNVRITFLTGKKKIFSDIGEILFTDFGISGPMVLTLSGKIVDWLAEGKDVQAAVDFKPAVSEEQIESRIMSVFESSPGKTIKNVLDDFLPKKIIGVFLQTANVSAEKISSYITQEERRRLVSCFKFFKMNVLGARPMNVAMVTRGGVSLKDINPKTMESRKVKGLYFAGEIIDVDADTGGFNLQAAFSTGCLAGRRIT